MVGAGGREVRARFWLLVLDAVFWLGFDQGSPVYLWVLDRASGATDWGNAR